MNGAPIRAVLAEDEPVLAQALCAELATVWPGLAIEAVTHDGHEALDALLARGPDVAFLDIRMPGLSGLEVAQALLEDWTDTQPPPLLVFVTAYDAHAVRAFEFAAVDYLLKPVARERLAACVGRLQERLRARRLPDLDSLVSQIAPLLAPAPRTGPSLRFLHAGTRDGVRTLRVEDVLYFQAVDKYVNAVVPDGEALLRTSLATLEPQLDPARFSRIHRGVIVNLEHVAGARRDAHGRLRLVLRGDGRELPVSRFHVDKFRAM